MIHQLMKICAYSECRTTNKSIISVISYHNYVFLYDIRVDFLILLGHQMLHQRMISMCVIALLSIKQLLIHSLIADFF